MKLIVAALIVALAASSSFLVRDLFFTTPAAAVAPLSADEARIVQEQWAQHEDVDLFERNSIGMQFVFIPPRSFVMGSFENEKDRKEREGPRHEVRITQPFYMSVYETTLGDFRRFVREAGYRFESADGSSDRESVGTLLGGSAEDAPAPWETFLIEQTSRHPVLNVNWHEAEAFCHWLSEKEGCTYRLPTEAEWEYACRAGTTSMFSSGDSLWRFGALENHSDQSLKSKPGWENKSAAPWDDGFPYTAPVGSFSANPWGLHDIHGNLREWCADWYDDEYYWSCRMSPHDDPQGPEQGHRRVARGGSWGSQESYCRSARRYYDEPDVRDDRTGFRIVREL